MSKIKTMYYSTLALATATMVSSPIFCDKIGDAAQGAAQGLSDSILSAVKWLIMIALIIGGLFLAFGTDRQSESVKERAPRMAVGLIMIAGAATIAGIIWGWFE